MNAAHTKATRADWLRAALDVFTSSGVEHVKVQPLAAQLGVGRASFYWYFTDRAALLDELQQVWAGTNTASIIDRSARPADTITAAVLGLFECWSDPSLFDPKLDTAMRD
ncbi:MAG: TetR/AcrR family transcriptional regulator [Acidimicrobiaceae bacterium]|nr:TetR/AcrR family transcriptional regulator [Acidimicrobiaceae bacterium]